MNMSSILLSGCESCNNTLITTNPVSVVEILNMTQIIRDCYFFSHLANLLITNGILQAMTFVIYDFGSGSMNKNFFAGYSAGNQTLEAENSKQWLGRYIQAAASYQTSNPVLKGRR